MSYFEDYVQDGLCCASCGGFLDGDEPGFTRLCGACQPDEDDKVLATVTSKPWPCPICDKRFKKQSHRNQHKRAAHPPANGDTQ